MRKNRGFTLIELIVVMIIIGILVLLATPRFINYIRLARYTNIINDTRVVETVSLPDMVRNNMDFPLGTSKYPVKSEDLLRAVKEDKAYMKDGLLRTDLEKESKDYPLVGQISKWKIKETKGRTSPNVVGEGESGLEGFYLLDKKKWVKPETRTRLPGEFLIDKEGNSIYVHAKGFGEIEEPEGEYKYTIKTYIKYDDSQYIYDEREEVGNEYIFNYPTRVFPFEEGNFTGIATTKTIDLSEELVKSKKDFLDDYGLRFGGFNLGEGDISTQGKETISFNKETREIKALESLIDFQPEILSYELEEDKENIINLIYNQKFIGEKPSFIPTRTLRQSDTTVIIRGYSISEWQHIMESEDKTYEIIMPRETYVKYNDGINYGDLLTKEFVLEKITKINASWDIFSFPFNFEDSEVYGIGLLGRKDPISIGLDLSRASELKDIVSISFYSLGLEELDLSHNKKLESIGMSSFANSNLSRLDLSENTRLNYIGEGAFSPGVLKEDDEAMYKEESGYKPIVMEELIFPKDPVPSLSIGPRAFGKYDIKKTNLRLGEGNSSIGDSAFYNSSFENQESFIDLRSIKNIYNLGEKAFYSLKFSPGKEEDRVRLNKAIREDLKEDLKKDKPVFPKEFNLENENIWQ